MAYMLKEMLAHKSNYGSARNTGKIKYIVVHYTANDGASDEANARYFQTANRKASAHYFVDDDSVTRSVPDNYVAWSVGGSRYSNYKTTGGASLYRVATNANTLNIELCDTLKDGTHNVSEETLKNAVILIKALMAKYHIPIDRVIRHFDVTGKGCPAYFVDNAKWLAFKSRLATVNANPYTEPTRILKKASPLLKGDDVKWVQWELTKHGYLALTDVDGYYGNDSYNAVVKFQKANGLTADGIVGKATISKMKEF